MVRSVYPNIDKDILNYNRADMPKCKICGQEYPPEKMVGDMCINCASAMMQKNGIDFGLGIENL